MFTGIVEELGRVTRINYSPIFQIAIRAKKVSENLRVSDSICINGVCLTVTEKKGEIFTVQVMPQTLRKTNLGELKVEDRVNLERAILPTSPLGGHFVTGDIDGLTQLERIERSATQWSFTLRPSPVALEGVSLTVAERETEVFKVYLIPYTLAHTNLAYRKEKDMLNLEVDILAKYLEQVLIGVNFIRFSQFTG